MVGIASSTSRNFNWITAVGLFVTAAMFIIFQYLQYRKSNWVFLLNGVSFGAAFFLIVSCISFANTSASRITEVLTKSIPSVSVVGTTFNINNKNDGGYTDDNQISDCKVCDYEIIGGRDTWIKFISEVPIQWTVYGFSITVQWIAGFASAGMLTLALTILPSLLEK